MSASVEIFAKKFIRISEGGPIRTLDLFSGCGGIALGFHAAGFQTIGSIEFDPHAARSFAINFLSTPGDGFELRAAAKDITKIDPGKALRMVGITDPIQDAVDVIVGGPPCQAFARVGRAKLREVVDHPEAFKLDKRGNLYLRYLAYIRAMKPLAILMENVPDVLNYGGHNISKEVCEYLEELGYHCQYTLLNSVYYGVPQMRERMFLVATHEACGKGRFQFPQPTHWCDLPNGYQGTRNVALKNIITRAGTLLDPFDGQEDPYYIQPPVASSGLKHAITAEEAVNDLPVLKAIELAKSGQLSRGAKRFDKPMDYGSDPRNGFQELMRNWPGFPQREGGIFDHVIRFLPRDFHFFTAMGAGWQYPELYAFAEDWFKKELPLLRKKKELNVPPVGTEEFAKFKARYVPPYDPSKFPNKWRKMERDRPSRTLLAHLGKDSYSHIHYDSLQGRTISVREGARLQSFPDGFILDGTINPGFKQVGNAVPALMAYAIALEIRAALNLPKVMDIRKGTLL